MKNILSFKNIVIALIILTSYIPIILYWLYTPDNMIYTWSPDYSSDFTSYLSKMKMGTENNIWLFRNYFIYEDNKPQFIFFFYILIGHLSALLHIKMIILYYIIKTVISYFLLNKLNQIINLFFINNKVSLYILFFVSTITLGVYEYEVYDTIKNFPHLTLSLYLFLSVLYMLFLKFKDENYKINFLKIAILFFIIVLVAPYMIVLINLVYIALMFKKYSFKEHFKNIIQINLLSFPYCLYILIIFQQPMYESWVAQSGLTFIDSLLMQGKIYLTLSVPLIYILIFYYKKIDYRFKSLLLIYFVCSISPLSFQRRLLVGVLAILLIMIFDYVLNRCDKDKIKKYFVFYLIFFYCLYGYISTDFLINKIIPVAKTGATSVYMTKENADILAKINDKKIKNVNILANIDVSSWIPGYTLNKVYLGHYSESYFFSDKLEKMLSFKNKDDLRKFITENKVNYVLSFKKELIEKYPDTTSYYFPILNNDTVKNLNYRKIYENDVYILYQTNIK